jgi:hypothetical protein
MALGLSSDWMVTIFIGMLAFPMAFALALAGRRKLW